MPSTISLAVTPRVSFCAVATPATASAPTSTATASRLFMDRSFRSAGWRRPSPRRVHLVDDVLVLGVHQGPLELHGRRQLLVLGRQDLLDEPERLDGLHPGQLPVHPLDLRPDQVLHLLGPAQ